MTKYCYTPSDAVRSHPYYVRTSLAMAVATYGHISLASADSYLKLNPISSENFSRRSFFAALHWDIRRWMDENGIVP